MSMHISRIVWFRLFRMLVSITLFLRILLFTDVTSVASILQQSLAAQIRIVNGHDGQIQDFPYQLSLRRNMIHICGGSVLDHQWAITAAHCIDGFEKSPKFFTLRIGSTHRNYGGIVIAVTNIYKHPSYNRVSMNFDVALLRTQSNKLRGDFVMPIKLPTVGETIYDNTKAVVSGWGHMSSSDNTLSSVLKYTTVFIINQEKCIEDMMPQGDITEAMFCAAARNTDACQGDSGGPIQAKETLIGITSWGVGCADPQYPGVYTRLSYSAIRHWIKLLTRL